MKEKVSRIFKDLKEGKLSLEKAEQQVWDLFAVSGIGSCEWCGTAKKNPNGLCGECGRFPSPSNYR